LSLPILIIRETKILEKRNNYLDLSEIFVQILPLLLFLGHQVL